MKKKCTIIIIAFVVVSLLTLGIILFVNKDNASYLIKYYMVDDRSPDRRLKVFKNDKEVEYKEIRFTDDVLLCKSSNPSVFYGDIEKESKLKIILTNDKEVIAKVVKGEEK